MSYLSRPVFDWPLQWIGPAQTIEYDVKPLTMGFGHAEFAPTARQVQRGWRFKFWLKTAVEIATYESWSAALKGRLNGFWFPEPNFAAMVISSPAAGHFNVLACGLLEFWNTEAPLHLRLIDLSGNATDAAVLNVESPSAGVERVTIDAAISPAAGWKVHRLLYVRQTEDTESATNIAEHWEERELSVVELPEEYRAAETGDEPIWFYWFYMDPPGESRRSWYFTSFAQTTTAGGNPYVSLPITHKGLTLSMESQEQTTKIESALKTGTPWAEMIPEVPERPLWVIISKNPYATPDSGQVLFGGPLKDIEMEGRKVTMTFTSWLDGPGRIPKQLFGAGCGWDLYDPRTCKVEKAPFELTVSFDAISGMVVTVSGAGLIAQPANYFARGDLDFGSGATRETRMILASTVVAAGAMQLTLSRPLRHAVVLNTATIAPGCDRTRFHCDDRFDNLPNYGGCDFMPRDNPVTKPPEIQGSGGKK